MEAARADPIRCVEDFNHTLQVLVRDLARRCPDDAMVASTARRVGVGIQHCPLEPIGTVGPYLYQYREQIIRLAPDQGAAAAAAAEEFFMANTFDAELGQATDQKKASLASYIIPRAKACARTLPAAEKREFLDRIVFLLGTYVAYLHATCGL